MICESHFRIKKNGEPSYRCYCRNPELIENYYLAIADKTQTWQVHHRLESCFTQKFLKEMNLYYDVEPEALIFLTEAEHRKIDSANKRHGKALSKKVLCIETEEIFTSVNDAYRKTGVSVGNISSVCNGSRKTAGGYHWKYI